MDGEGEGKHVELGLWFGRESSPTRTMLVWSLGLAKYSDMVYPPFDVFPILKSRG